MGVHAASIFLVPFAPPTLAGFLATMGPLTPERRFFGPHLSRHERRPIRSGLLASWIEPSDHSVSNHPTSSHDPGLVSDRRLTAACTARSTHPLGRVPHGVTGASPPYSRLATTTGRIEFVILRTGRSPPVASHPASQRRSYVRLQSSNPTFTGTYTLPISIHLQAHIGVRKADWFRPPFPPNRTGGFPASGSPVDGVTSERIERPWRGRFSG